MLSPALALFDLALLALWLVHLRETRMVRVTLGALVASLKAPPVPAEQAAPSRPMARASSPAPSPPIAESPALPEIAAERESIEVLTQVMPNPHTALPAQTIDPSMPPSKPAQIAAGLSRPRSQRAGLHATPPRPPPVKVGPLPPVVPPPRPRTATLPSMPAPAPAAGPEAHAEPGKPFRVLLASDTLTSTDDPGDHR